MDNLKSEGNEAKSSNLTTAESFSKPVRVFAKNKKMKSEFSLQNKKFDFLSITKKNHGELK